MLDNGETLHKWITDLFPLNRSIVGKAYDESLEYITKLFPSTPNILEFPTGMRVHGWTIPEGWNLFRGTIQSLGDELIVDSNDSNLHVWSHSVPVNMTVSREELESHLLTLPDKPEAIPYATTYYKKNWGFSLKKAQYDSLSDKYYKIDIQSEFKNHSLKVLEFLVPGKSKREILFTTYLCHPSMANNELSGPVLLTAIARYISKLDLNYTYRFVIAPETIGHIAYLSVASEYIKSNTAMAFNLTCVGGGSEWSLLSSPNTQSATDIFAQSFLDSEVSKYKIYDFLERGSDERQYCSPEMNIPMVSIMRSKYSEYAEYHTSLDNLNFVTPQLLEQSLDLYKKLIGSVDFEGRCYTTSPVEPFLTDLLNYPSLGARTSSYNNGDHRIALQILAFASGLTLSQISKRTQIPLTEIVRVAKKCVDINILVIRPL
jgi:aminopeptidase-like protein